MRRYARTVGPGRALRHRTGGSSEKSRFKEPGPVSRRSLCVCETPAPSPSAAGSCVPSGSFYL